MKNGFFLNEINVSRETLKKFHNYIELLKKWNCKKNLVSSSSLENVWARHINDSAQLYKYIDLNAKRWVDLGSGAGFPGLIVATIAKDKELNLKFFLIESDKRKCVFLEQAAALLGVNVDIFSTRIQDCSFLNADIISARALAPLNKLIPLLKFHGSKDCKGLFLKGKKVFDEISRVSNKEDYKITISPSIIDSTGFVVEIKQL